MPLLFCNLVIGLTLKPREQPRCNESSSPAAPASSAAISSTGCWQPAAVTVYDNFSTGRRDFLAEAAVFGDFRLVEGDLLDARTDAGTWPATISSSTWPPTPTSASAPSTRARTWNRTPSPPSTSWKRCGPTASAASPSPPPARSTASQTSSPRPEDAPFPVQTSLYGASKLAGEGLIAAYATGFGFQGYIFRFVSILGERYTHGHVFDFYTNCGNPHQIEVLGNGQQRKSYLYVQDCIDAMLLAIGQGQRAVNIFNLGTEEYCKVDDSLGWICDIWALIPQRRYSGGERGWIGDNPFIFLDTAKIRSLGWRPKLTIREAVLRTLHPDPTPVLRAAAAWCRLPSGTRWSGRQAGPPCRQELHARCRLWTVAPGLRHGRLPCRAGHDVVGLDSGSECYRATCSGAGRRCTSRAWPNCRSPGWLPGDFLHDRRGRAPWPAPTCSGWRSTHRSTITTRRTSAGVRARLDACRRCPSTGDDGADLVAGACRLHARAGSGTGRAKDCLRLIAGKPAAGQGHRRFLQPGAGHSRHRRRLRPDACWRSCSLPWACVWMDVDRVRRDDQACAECFPGHVGDVHQRIGPAVRGGRGGRQGGRARPEERGTDRAAGLSVAGSGLRRRHAGPRPAFPGAVRPGSAGADAAAARRAGQQRGPQGLGARVAELLAADQAAGGGRPGTDVQARHQYAAAFGRR